MALVQWNLFRELTLAGERKSESERQDEKHHRIERACSRFARRFVLPEDAVADQVTAECRDGVLTVHVARTETPKPRTIEVKVG